MLSPLQLQFAIAFWVSGDPYSELGSDLYDSPAGKEAKQWLLDEGLIRDGVADSKWGEPTEKLRVFVEHLCSQPLPVQTWTIPAPDRNA